MGEPKALTTERRDMPDVGTESVMMMMMAQVCDHVMREIHSHFGNTKKQYGIHSWQPSEKKGVVNTDTTDESRADAVVGKGQQRLQVFDRSEDSTGELKETELNSVLEKNESRIRLKTGR